MASLTSTDAVDAIVKDDWPRPMVDAGLLLHQQTWDIDALYLTLQDELNLAGNIQDQLPKGLVHVWPAMPGSGISPVLFAAAAGVEKQWVKASSRGTHFGRFAASTSLEILEQTSIPFVVPAETLVVSGSDETISAVRTAAKGRHIVGYGHRVSFAITAGEFSEQLATDIVMWHQQGCFSVRAVMFVGEAQACEDFCAELGAAIQRKEHQLEAQLLSNHSIQAHRVQRRGLAEFKDKVFGEGTGWVELTSRPWTGDFIAHHAVSVHRIDSISELASVVQVPSHQLQGAALCLQEADPRWDDWSRAASECGVTRVDIAGHMQSPPISWPHDGMSNLTVLFPPAEEL